MNTVIPNIEYLISRKDCVIIPGFGTILAHNQSASIDYERMLINPPTRIYAFNRSLAPNDGLLAYTISQSQRVSIEEASRIMQRDVEIMNKQLQATGALSLGRIGMLKYDSSSQAVEFTPYPVDQLGVSTAWLPIAKDFTASQSKDVPEIEYKRYSPMQRFMRIAASIALLICIWFMASTPISIDEAAFASLSPQLKQYDPSQDMALPQITIVAPAPELAKQPEAMAAPSPIASVEKKESKPEISAPMSDNKYLVIVGSFGTRSEAQKFIHQHPDAQLDIFEKDAHIRVYAGAYPTESAAYKAIHDNSTGFGSAWVCKR